MASIDSSQSNVSCPAATGDPHGESSVTTLEQQHESKPNQQTSETHRESDSNLTTTNENKKPNNLNNNRKCRKRKRHHNNIHNNNKKWIKFKRQTSHHQQQQQQLQQLSQSQHQQQQQQLQQTSQQQQQQQSQQNQQLQQSHQHHNNNKIDCEIQPQSSKNQNNRKHIYGPKNVNKSIFKNNSSHRGGGGIGGVGGGNSKFFLPNDKRLRNELIIPPTKFLLGGNISDPLNLNSLQDEALNASMNAATPKSSPITTPPKIDVIIPPNMFDPLHLLDNVDSIEYEQLLISPMKRKIKHRNRKKKPKKKPESPTRLLSANASATSVSTSEQGDPDVMGDLFINTDDDEQTEDQGKLPTSSKKREVVADGQKDSISEKEKCTRDLRLDLEPDIQLAVTSGGRKRRISENCQNKNKSRRLDSMDKIVSPVIPQPGAWKRPPILLPMGAPRHRVRNSSTSISEEVTTPDTNTSISSSDTITGHCSNAVDDAVTLADDPSTNQSDAVMVSASTSAANPTQSANVAGDAHQLQEQQQQQQCVTNLPTQSKYQYGNYNRYYGFNSLNEFTDVRLKIFQRHSYLFKDKDILDIGCNVGHMTIAIGRKLHPKSLIGIDIDASLISRARHNASMYVKILPEQNKNDGQKTETTTKRPKHNKRDRHRDEYYPISFPICYGGVPQLLQCETESIKDLDNKESAEPSTSNDAIANAANDEEDNTPLKMVNSRTSKSANSFPNNIFFRTYNYVITDETQLANDTPQYDLILCLSVTKWIHLNFGDSGLKLTFKRIFNQLRPGGKLILEAQNWASYKKKKKLTETIFNNYKSIEFFPNSFHEYLLSPEVGFSHSYALGIPRHLGKGFRRPIQLYVKGDFTPSQICWSDNYNPQTPYESYRSYYADVKRQQQLSSAWGGHSRHYSTRFTPSQGLSSTSQYYNPLETDSYLPSYDNEVQTRHYCFASPLYSTVWSPPPSSGRKSASNTPLFGSIRKVNDGDEFYSGGRRHVYLPTGGYDGGRDSVRSLDECSRSPQTVHVYATGSGSNSAREVDLLESNSPKEHVYASNACDNSSSPTQQYNSGESSRSVEVEQDEQECINDVKNGFS